MDPAREPEQSEQGGDTTPIVPVTVVLDNPDDAKSIDRATVRVSFTARETREDVLSVPVGALLALPGGGYGVEVVAPGATGTAGTKRVAVETGLFAGGLVEITGEGIDAGTTVVVAEA